MTVSTLAPRARRRMIPPDRPDAVTQYALDVTAGRIVACRLVRKACERHLSDLATGHQRGLTFDREEAEKAIAFYPLLHHYQGRADAIILTPWECFIIGSAWGWKRADGTRRFRFIYVEVAAKNGKTTIGAGAMLRLAFFDDEPGAQCYSLASKRDQAKLAWTAGSQMVRLSPSLRRRGIRVFGGRGQTASITHEASASFYQPLGRDSDSDQGINPHGALLDELHVYDTRDVVDNVEKAASARRQPMIWKITTSGVKRDSVWWDERSDAVAVIEGRATDDSLFAVIYTLDEGDDPFDEAVWPKANPNLNVSVQLDFLRERAAKAQRSPGALAAYLRFHMNVPTAVTTRALSIEEWDANGAEPQIPDGAGGYGGLDLASVKDLTALILLFRTPRPEVKVEHACQDRPDCEHFWYDVLCRFWCPQVGIDERSRRDGVPYADWVRDGFLIATPGDITDYSFVRNEILSLAESYAIGDIGFDRWNATQLVIDLMGDGAQCTAIPQTHAGLGPAWRELEKVVLEHGMRHGGHPILRWMAGNVEVETDASGNQKPSKRHSSERIDGMVALDMALNRWLAHGAAPAVWSAA